MLRSVLRPLSFHCRRPLTLLCHHPFNPRRLWTSAINGSSSGVYKHLHHQFRIDDLGTAQELVDHFLPEERALLLKLLQKKEQEEREHPADGHRQDGPSTGQLKQLFIINTIPFVGFGILDNMIMILAGEYIDQSLGAILSISTMAAAALGNTLSDVAGVGLAHYVELIVVRLGFKHPVLTARQLESRTVRYAVNGARAFGLVVGCLIGMFPLLFFKAQQEVGVVKVVVVKEREGEGEEEEVGENKK